MREMRLVEWVDSMGSHGWEPLDESIKMRPLHIFTCGFVIDEGDDYVTIAQSYDERPEGRPHTDNLICIPKFAIVISYSVKEATRVGSDLLAREEREELIRRSETYTTNGAHP